MLEEILRRKTGLGRMTNPRIIRAFSAMSWIELEADLCGCAEKAGEHFSFGSLCRLARPKSLYLMSRSTSFPDHLRRI